MLAGREEVLHLANDRLQSAALVAAISAFVYSRAATISIFYANAPSRIPLINNVKNLSVRFTDHVRNCEDVAIDTFEAFAILSCDPGRGAWNTVMVCFAITIYGMERRE